MAGKSSLLISSLLSSMLARNAKCYRLANESHPCGGALKLDGI